MNWENSCYIDESFVIVLELTYKVDILNQPPTASITADISSGSASLTVSFVGVGVEDKKWPSGRNWSNLSHLFEFGVQAHEISPKKRKALMWVDDKTSDFVFVRGTVNHPGIRPEPHLRPAMKAKANTIAKDYNKRMNEQLEKKADKIAAKAGLRKA